MSCIVEACDRSAMKRGMCNKHYLRWWKFGDPNAGSTPHGDAARFLNEIVLQYEGDECILWPYAQVQGYGQIRVDGKLHLVSRLACESANGRAPNDTDEAAHSCGNGHLGCATKRHLRWATRAENRQDMIEHGRSNRGKSVRFNRLSDMEKQKIRELVGTVPDAALARQFGVTPSAIRHYRQEIAA